MPHQAPLSPASTANSSTRASSSLATKPITSPLPQAPTSPLSSPCASASMRSGTSVEVGTVQCVHDCAVWHGMNVDLMGIRFFILVPLFWIFVSMRFIPLISVRNRDTCCSCLMRRLLFYSSSLSLSESIVASSSVSVVIHSSSVSVVAHSSSLSSSVP